MEPHSHVTLYTLFALASKGIYGEEHHPKTGTQQKAGDRKSDVAKGYSKLDTKNMIFLPYILLYSNKEFASPFD